MASRASTRRASRCSSGRRIESETVIWSAGVSPSPAIAALPLPKTKRGALITGPTCACAGASGLWALGDCAAIPDGEGGVYPMTAQHAIREGPHLADNIVRALRGRPTQPFRYHTLGMMASLGGRRAVAELPGNHVLTGFLAWFLWRTYYLAGFPGSTGVYAWPSTGRSNCSFRATSPSCASATRRSRTQEPGRPP